MPGETKAKSWGHLSVPQLAQDFQGFPRMSFIMITTSAIKQRIMPHKSEFIQPPFDAVNIYVSKK